MVSVQCVFGGICAVLWVVVFGIIALTIPKEQYYNLLLLALIVIPIVTIIAYFICKRVMGDLEISYQLQTIVRRRPRTRLQWE